MAAIHSFGFQGLLNERAETVSAHPAQPAHPESQTSQADGHIGVGTSDATLKALHLCQLTAGLGHEHGHGLTEREDFGAGSSRVRHGESPQFRIGSSSHAIMS